MDVTVTARGDAKKLWDTLLLYLVNNKYRIEKQVPPTSLVAKRGSKAASLVIETKNINFRELHVLFIPQGPDTYGVRFEFKFPVWMITLPAAKKELGALADGYLAQIGMGPSAVVTQEQSIVCPKCKATNRPDAAFCEKCGTKLEAEGPAQCPKCQAALGPDAKFCPKCGAQIR